MKETIRIIILLSLILTGMLLQSCANLDGNYIGRVHEIDSTFAITFVDSTNIVIPYEDMTYERCGTMAYDLLYADTTYRVNCFDGQWQFRMPVADTIYVAYLTQLKWDY